MICYFLSNLGVYILHFAPHALVDLDLLYLMGIPKITMWAHIFLRYIEIYNWMVGY
jgi:hypothetical protein